MIEGPATHFEIYLTKLGQNNLAKREMIALMQLLRIINALRFQITLLLHTKDEKRQAFSLKGTV